jgi:bisphosphoglycerate-independent phosphoglycerate mutase (AlkP superfamily)
LANKHGIILANKADCDLISSMTDVPKTIRKVELEDVDRSEAQEKIFLEGIFGFIKDKMKEKKEDLIVVDLPFIADACRSKNFARVEKVVKTIDSLLPDLESCILENGGILLISSLYGMAEEITDVSFPFGERIQFSSNPLPLIEVSNYSKKPIQPCLGILDLMNIKYNQTYLKKIIINYLSR